MINPLTYAGPFPVRGFWNGSTFDETSASPNAMLTSQSEIRLSLRQPSHPGTVLRTTSALETIKYNPHANSDDARGKAFLAAKAHLQPGDTISLSEKCTYAFDDDVTINVANVTIQGNKSKFTRANGTPTNWVLEVTSPAGSHVRIFDLDIDGNYSGVDLGVTGKRGEGLRINGSGTLTAENVSSHDSPVSTSGGTVDDAAVNFIIQGSGMKRLIQCRSDNPSYAGFRLQGLYMEFIGCDSLNTAHHGNKGRLWVMDGGNVEYCSIDGGDWETDQDYEVNCNFDPAVDDSFWCNNIMIRGVHMRFPNHDNGSGDSYIKFDNCSYVRMLDCTMEHSNFSDVTLNDGHKEHLPQLPPYFRETWVTIARTLHFYMDGCVSDAPIKFAGSHVDQVPINRIALIRNSIFGKNAEIDYAISNTSQCADTQIDSCIFMNIKGSGAGNQSVVIRNDNHQAPNGNIGGQFITVKNCLFETAFDNPAMFVTTCPFIGAVCIENSKIVQADGSQPVYLTFTATERLFMSALPANRRHAYLTRNPLSNTPCTLGGGTYANTHPTPTVAVDETTNCFTGITAVEGSVIENFTPTGNGAGHASKWIANAAGIFVEAPVLDIGD